MGSTKRSISTLQISRRTSRQITMTDPILHIQQLQAQRGRRLFDPSIARRIKAIATDARRTQRRFSSLIDAWEAHVPADLARHSAIEGVRAGTVQVLAASASVRYALDRFLREGGLDTLRRQYNGPLRQVRVRVGDPTMFADPDQPRDGT